MNGSPRATQALNGSSTAMLPHTALGESALHVSVHMPPGKPTAFELHAASPAHAVRVTLATRSRFASSGGNTGRPDPRYKLPNAYQGARAIRLMARISF